MVDINLEKRQGPSVIPWLVGLVVLALLIWGIAALVNTRKTTRAAEAPPGTQPETPAAPAAMPAPGAPEGTAVELSSLLPLGPEDVGQRVSARGVVVGKPTGTGFWLRSGNDVLWVESGAKAQPGQQLTGLTGTLEQATPAESSQRVQEAALQPESGWTLQKTLYLNVEPAAGTTSPSPPPDTSGG